MQETYSISLAGTQEIGQIALNCGYINEKGLSLQKLCAQILKVHISKDESTRVSMDWQNARLSKKQIHYSACDVALPICLFNMITSNGKFGKMPRFNDYGTSVRVLGTNGITVATGVLIDEGLRFADNNVTSSRAVILINTVSIPAFKCSHYRTETNSKCLSDFGPTPFKVLLNLKQLQTIADQASIPFSPPLIDATNTVELQEFEELDDDMEEEIRAESLLPEAQDDEQDLDFTSIEQVQQSFYMTNETLAEVDVLVGEEEGEDQKLPWSRILGDVFHLMKNVRVPKNHGLRKVFVRAFSDAFFIADEMDKRLLLTKLEGQKWEDIIREKPKWVWKRVRRHIPSPMILKENILKVFKIFGPLIDAATKVPLFNKDAWKRARGVIKVIEYGLVSDPPNVSFYFQDGTDRDLNMPLWRCIRGTNTTEGGIHRPLIAMWGGYNVGIEYAVSTLDEWRTRHNISVSIKNSEKCE